MGLATQPLVSRQARLLGVSRPSMSGDNACLCAQCALDPPAIAYNVVHCLGSSLRHCSRANVKKKKKMTPGIWGITKLPKILVSCT